MADSRDSKCDIMKASLEILAEEGYHNLSFAGIADRAEISKSLISYHFDTKKELFSELFDWMAEETLKMKEEDDKDDIVALIDLILPEEEKDRKIQKSILEIGMISSEDGELQKSYQRLNRELKKGIRDSRDEELSEEKADMVLSLLTGAAFRREMLGENINRDLIKDFVQDCES